MNLTPMATNNLENFSARHHSDKKADKKEYYWYGIPVALAKDTVWLRDI